MLLANLPLRSGNYPKLARDTKGGGTDDRLALENDPLVYAAIGVNGLAQVYVAIRESDDALFGNAR